MSAADPLVEQAQAQHAATQALLRESYEAQLDEQMGQLHDQLIVFISTAQLPLPQVLLVLEILISETTEQARQHYMGA